MSPDHVDIHRVDIHNVTRPTVRLCHDGTVTTTVLAGGVGAARFLRGLIKAVDPTTVTAIINVGDDTVLHGLHISPDIDTVTYTLAEMIDPERGWGLVGETWRSLESLARFAAVRPVASAAGNTWFGLGDQDLATHMYRTARLAEGATLTEVTGEIARAFGVPCRLIPVSNDPIRTVVHSPGLGDLAFQEYFVKHHHSVAVDSVRFDGMAHAAPAPGVLAALANADTIVIAPSNPIVSIGPLLNVSGIIEALTARRSSTVAISPIVAGAALKGPADRMLTELGFEASVVGVARMYAPIASTLVIDNADAALADAVEAEGIRCVVTNAIMSTPAVSAALATEVLAAMSGRV